MAALRVKGAAIQALQRTGITRQAVPKTFAIRASAIGLHASTMARVRAVLAFSTRRPRIRTVAGACVLEECATVFAFDVADLALVASEASSTLAGACFLVQHTAIEAPRGTLLTLNSLGQGWALALTRLPSIGDVPYREVPAVLALESALAALAAAPGRLALTQTSLIRGVSEATICTTSVALLTMHATKWILAFTLATVLPFE